MLTRLRIKNFKRFPDADIELGQSVVFIGQNNSGKTTALQALALWDVGIRKWNEKRGGKTAPEKRPGVTINRRDLMAIPVPNANSLWRNLHTRDVRQIEGKTKTQNVRIDIILEGVSEGHTWQCGLEFDYANEESFYCRPLRISEDAASDRMGVPDDVANVKLAFLPPMSGLAATEPKWEAGRINVLLGEGQTAQVLRNLCYHLYEQEEPRSDWNSVVKDIQSLFGVQLQPPVFVKERGEITMAYQDPEGCQLDISSAGRGLQQTLLLLTHLYANPQTVLLLDEPDAHLEVLRQRQTYQLITKIASEKGSQIICASHSEVVLNEAANRDVVIAFVGQPHRINNHSAQVIKALTTIGFDQYYQAELKGWVLYLEGSTDLAILQAFAKTLSHPAAAVLERPFVHYVSTNLPKLARDHFHGLREAKPDLVGFALFDRIERPLDQGTGLTETMWRKREIENYLCHESVLLTFARHDLQDDLFGRAESGRREAVMREAIMEVSNALSTLDQPTLGSDDLKTSDAFLRPLFSKFFGKLGLPNMLQKSDYHSLAALVPTELIDSEVNEKLDGIVKIANKARPKGL
ncbi:MAG TPA: AAA family ATPase [Candidatus Limnocylindria bacterium]|jgi:ABC-type taurine transport system ATPase subunit|nr:AAA family ATPase [Candidatus Limnocylindria bacterium]